MESKSNNKKSKSLTVTVDGVVIGFMNIATTLPEATQEQLHDADAMRAVLDSATLTVRQDKPVSGVLNDLLAGVAADKAVTEEIRELEEQETAAA